MADWKKLNASLPALAIIRRLQLAESGYNSSEWRGKCPFHLSYNPRSRSFAVSLTLRKWYCHNCHRKGDMIDLWAEVRGCTPAEAVKELESLCL